MRTLATLIVTLAAFFWTPCYLEAVSLIGDFDGDGKTDVAVYEDATGNWFIRQSTAGFRIHPKFGGPGFIPVAGDYDGDGKADLAVYQTANGNWFVIGSAFGFFAPALNFGGPGFIPIPGDFDGDGVIDPAVYEERTGNWFTVQSSAGFSAPALNFGGLSFTPASTPVPAGLPKITGIYNGSGSSIQGNCGDPANDVSFSFSGSANISTQTGASFSGSATLVSGANVNNITLSGTVNVGGQITGTFTFSLFVSGIFAGGGNGTFTAQLTDNQLLANFAAQFTVGEFCAVKGSLLASR